MTMIIINVGLLIVAFILAKTILKQKKLILSYDKCSKLNGNMQRLMFLANLAKVRGYDVEIDYSTLHDYTHVFFYKNNPNYAKCIYSDETFEEAIKDLERLIK